MDTRNVILATALSIGILLLWSVFFQPPITPEQTINNQQSEEVNPTADLGLGSLDESLQLLKSQKCYLLMTASQTPQELKLILQEFQDLSDLMV